MIFYQNNDCLIRSLVDICKSLCGTVCVYTVLYCIVLLGRKSTFFLRYDHVLHNYTVAHVYDLCRNHVTIETKFYT